MSAGADTAVDLAVAGLMAVIATAWPPSLTLIAAFPVLGIPLAALAAAMIGSGYSYLRQPGQQVETVPLRLFGISMDAFLAGWVAVTLFHVTPLNEYGIQAIPIEAIAGLLAFCMQLIRKHFMHYFDRAFQAILNGVIAMLPRGKSTNDPGEAP